MNKRTKLETAIELGKDLLILLLACSALWMLAHSGLLQRLDLSGSDSPRVTEVQNDTTGQAEAVHPIRITATIQGGTEPVRYSAQYDDVTVDAMFQQTAGLLKETLSSAEAPQEISRQDWERALARAPGLCFDFQGEMPLSVLSGWLGVESDVTDAVVRRVLLTVWEDTASLYYYDLDTQRWCRSTSQVVTTLQMENAMAGLSSNGAFFAFESEQTSQMAPDTLLVPDPGPMAVYRAANPMTGGRSALEKLMSDLGFHLSGCVFYTAAGEEVARIGSDTVRLSKDGVVEYHVDEDNPQQFPVSLVSGRSRIFAAVDSCAQLLWRAMNERCDQARAYLSRVETTENGWYLEYEYSLNGVPLGFDAGPAASFEVKNGYITAFTIRLRSYTEGEDQQIILPPIQAAAAMSALALDGREMQLMYQDRGEEAVRPGWTAVSEEAG